MSSFNRSQGLALHAIAELWKQGFLEEFGFSPFRFNDVWGTVSEQRQRQEEQKIRYYLIIVVTFNYPPVSKSRKIKVVLRSEEWDRPMSEYTYFEGWEAIEAQVQGAEAITANRRLIRVGHTMDHPCYWIDPAQAQKRLEEKY